MVRATWALAGVVIASAVVSAALSTGCGPSGGSGFKTGADAGTVAPSEAGHPLGVDSGGPLKSDGAMSIGSPDTGAPGQGGQGPHGCDPTCAAAGGQCVAKVCVLHENPGGISAAAEQQLSGPTTADPSFTWLYPYDATVFPRGLIAPTLQFGGSAPEAIKVHITYSSMDYIGYFGGSSTASAKLPAASWTAVTEGAWAGDAVEVSVTKLAGGQVSGPITETWSIAQGSMRGQIYYETYGSTLAGGPDSVGIMSIAPGASAPTVLKSGCGNVCHTASADGSTLVANVALGFSSSSYDLKNAAATIYAASSEIFTYGGLYPDGSFVMSATNYRTWINAPSRLYDTATGVNIPAAGWDGLVTNGGTVAFSPDGKYLAFIHEDQDDGAGQTLAMMDFAVATKTFSNLVDMTTDTGSTIGWPAFTPDSNTIVYHVGSSQAFETDGGSTGNVYQVDVATRAAARLNALDGYDANGTTTYLPAMDPDLNFAPTVLPEAVGGYFWVVFTSHRSYGNTLPTQDNMDQNGKLWVAALDLSATPGKDSSHPAFYLDGQESEADNLRGFWVLPPCQQSGTSCSTGDQCCTGFCRASSGGASTCVTEPVGSCSNEYEKCTTSADCCGASSGFSCIGGYCSEPPPK
jgi:hypothetical protein